MRLIFILLFLFTSVTFAQKGFERKHKSPADKTNAPKGNFLEIQGEKIDKNARQISIKGLSTKLISKYKVTKDPESGRVLMIENFSKSIAKARMSAQALASDFLGDVKTTLQIQDPDAELVLQSTATDEIGMTHMQLQQKYKNVPVYGGEIWLHAKDNKIETLNGRNFPTPKLASVKPQLTEARAIELAMADVSKKSIVQKNISNGFITQGHATEMFIYYTDEKGTDARLTYYLTIRPNMLERWVYFVDANNGEILKKFNHTCSLDGPFTASAKDLNNVTRTINIQQFGGTFYMMDTQRPMYNKTNSKLPDNPVGGILTIDAKNTPSDNTKYSHITSSNGTGWSPSAVSAHYNAGFCYDYFRTKFNRNSLDGKGSSVISVINIADEDGKGMDNAYWNGQFMGYGNGRDAFKPLAGALDVAGHEMTHGVVEATARLEYQNQSGALNESFADIFGAMIDRDDWTLGEDVIKAGAYPSGALRSLQNPNQGGTKDPGYQPKNMSQYLFLKNTEDEDNGGVHINSGIPNYAFYLFASNANVGKDRAELVYYRALTTYLTRTSKFIDARLAVVKAAADLYGASSAVVNAAKAAFDEVGIADPSANTGTPAPTPTPQTIPVNNGGDYILVYDPTDGKLYTAKTTETNYKPISSSGCLNKPSITDDGQFAYFVGKDKNIRRIALSGTFKEDKMTSDAAWDNVAVSKDGKRLAGLTEKEEPYMYIFDLENGGKSAKFKLYNPTYSAGVSTGEVLFADALEWDYSGEVIIYDASNRLSSISGAIEYWDVGYIRVWNVAKKTFGDGKIEKLFTDLEEGESIGNPSFSKNSQDIIAFDYFSSDDPDVYYQIGVDLENNDIDIINENNDIGYPGYTRLDDKMLFNSLKDNGQHIVKIINLQADKIRASGDAKELFTDAKWAVWYSQGTRVLPTKTDQNISFGTITDKTPGTSFTLAATASSKLLVEYTIESGNASVNGSRITLGNTPGKVKVQAFQVGNSQFNPASASQTFCILPPTPKITANGNNLVASGGTKYQWYLNGASVNGLTQTTITPASTGGVYTVRVVTDDGCVSLASNAVEVKAVVLGNELNENINVSIYPNPASDELRIELPSGVVFREVTFYTSNGLKAMQSNKLSGNNSFNISQLAKGTYVVNIETSHGRAIKKIVRE